MERKRPRLRLGHANTDITPPLGLMMGGYDGRTQGCQVIVDRLRADAIYLEQGDVKTLWVTLDLVAVSGKWGWEVRNRIAERIGVRPELVILFPSHTHFGPATGTYETIDDPTHKNYLAKLADQLVDIAEKAASSPLNVTVHIGRSDVEPMVYNRRMRRPDGSCCTVYTLPPPENEKGLVFGPIDPTLTVLRFDQEDGSPALVFYSAAIHPVVGNDVYYGISADYPGVVRSILERELDTPVAFALGTAGNLVPIQRGKGQRERIGRFLAGAALEALSTTKPLESSLAVSHEQFNLPTAKRLSRDEMEVLLDQARKRVEDVHNSEDDRARQRAAEQERRIVSLIEYANIYGPGDTVPFEVAAIALGELGIVTFPGEVLVETGIHISTRSPFPMTLTLTLANQCTGYLPTRTALWEGGYEASVSMMAPESEGVASDKAIERLIDVWNELITKA